MKDIQSEKFMIGCRVVSQKEALEDGTYSMYIFKNEKPDRIKMFHNGCLYKVVYPEREKPFDGLKAEHFKNYPGVTLEVWEERKPYCEAGYEYRSHVFNECGEQILLRDCILDAKERIIKEVEMDDNFEVVVEYGYVYDGDELVEAIEFDKEGNRVGGRDFRD
ncbi:hypothetical protein [Chitinimonas lacunae]|uniref:Uncharacterized protein n=1 Tax=Chitinimonas lacunae TaxID=1963018 RepID=A0ABV8MX04_9NEIS